MNTLETRVTALEADVRTLREDVAVIKSNYATKADINELKAELKAELHSSLRLQTMWSVGTIIAAASLVFAIMRMVPAT
ncbi:hemolysin XhlA [Cobetia sp. MB87]|uniref:hemolysin XhlA n=1 Tax=Cobetia sp. MB87 TaxID=2588451 RepID=UPI00140A67D1|nr:hemolysin XhlA [Cobetia sp. MB87]NHH86535.1 hypothetical protein [Cobetia sp. MB87]